MSFIKISPRSTIIFLHLQLVFLILNGSLGVQGDLMQGGIQRRNGNPYLSAQEATTTATTTVNAGNLKNNAVAAEEATGSPLAGLTPQAVAGTASGVASQTGVSPASGLGSLTGVASQAGGLIPQAAAGGTIPDPTSLKPDAKTSTTADSLPTITLPHTNANSSNASTGSLQDATGKSLVFPIMDSTGRVVLQSAADIRGPMTTGVKTENSTMSGGPGKLNSNATDAKGDKMAKKGAKSNANSNSLSNQVTFLISFLQFSLLFILFA